jgi:hypothetical protein
MMKFDPEIKKSEIKPTLMFFLVVAAVAAGVVYKINYTNTIVATFLLSARLNILIFTLNIIMSRTFFFCNHGGPRSWVWACLTLRSAPDRHQNNQHTCLGEWRVAKQIYNFFDQFSRNLQAIICTICLFKIRENRKKQL